MTKDKALKLALEALETELCIDWTNNDEFNASAEQMHEAITAIKEALAQPEPWCMKMNGCKIKCEDCPDEPPLPVQRTWVGLTIEDKKEYVAQDFGGSRTDAMDWTEKRLMEKNT